jgi:hypothetical protein
VNQAKSSIYNTNIGSTEVVLILGYFLQQKQH